MNEWAKKEPLYRSKASARSLWQSYTIYSDRIELQCKILFHTFVIKSADIIDIELKNPGWDFSKWWVLNLDFSPFHTHVLLCTKSSPWRKYFRFTPHNPQFFVEIVKNNLLN